MGVRTVNCNCKTAQKLINISLQTKGLPGQLGVLITLFCSTTYWFQI